MRKTLLITVDFPPMVGGVARYLERLITHLPAGQVNVLFRPSSRWWSLVWQILFVIKKEKINMLWAAQPLPVGTAVYIVHRLTGLPYIVNTHGMDVAGPLTRRGWRLTMLKRVLRSASAVTVNSRYTADLVRQCGVADDHIHFIYPCPDQLATTLSVPRRLAGKNVILTVGRLVARKGHDLVVKALPVIIQQIPEAVYVIVGDGSNKDNLLQLTHQLHLDDYVVFTGRLTDLEIDSWYRSADVLVMPARQEISGDVEGFGLVFLEAGQYGLPVVGGKSGGQSDAIIDGQTGYLVDPLDTTELATTIIRLLSDESLRQRLGLAGRQRASRDFQWSAEAKKLQSLLS